VKTVRITALIALPRIAVFISAIVLAAILVLPPGAVAGRSGFGGRGFSGISTGHFFHRGPGFRHTFFHHQINRALFAHHLHRHHNFAHHRHPNQFGLGFGGTIDPYYYGSPYDPSDYSDYRTNVDAAAEPNRVSYDRPRPAAREPSCQATDYVVPNTAGKDSHVTVIRC